VSHAQQHLAPLLHFDAPESTQRLLFIPALGTPVKFYRHFAAALCRLGLSVTVMELRGYGDSLYRVGRGTDFGMEDLLADVLASYRSLCEQSPDIEVIVGGHSLGGHLAMLAAAQLQASELPVPNKLLMVAHGMPYWRYYRGTMQVKILVIVALIRCLAPLLGYFPGHRLGFAGREALTVMRDWSRWALGGRYPEKFYAGLASYSGHVYGIDIEGDIMTPAVVSQKTADVMSKARHSRSLISLSHTSANLHHAWAKKDNVAQVAMEIVSLLQEEQ
jgi:predicted alpha/beta hydrolase